MQHSCDNSDLQFNIYDYESRGRSMGFFVLKCLLGNSEQVLFENIDENRAKKITRSLVEQHAEMLLSENPKLSEKSALEKAESLFKVTDKLTPNKRRF